MKRFKSICIGLVAAGFALPVFACSPNLSTIFENYKSGAFAQYPGDTWNCPSLINIALFKNGADTSACKTEVSVVGPNSSEFQYMLNWSAVSSFPLTPNANNEYKGLTCTKLPTPPPPPPTPSPTCNSQLSEVIAQANTVPSCVNQIKTPAKVLADNGSGFCVAQISMAGGGSVDVNWFASQSGPTTISCSQGG